MNKSAEINELSLALSKAQGELSNVEKDKQGYSYKYADLASIIDESRDALAANGLAIMQFVSTSPAQDNVRVETMITHASGQWITSYLDMPVSGKKGLSLEQCVGSASTYARRYALAGVLGIAQEDNDGAAQGANKAQIAMFHELVNANDSLGIAALRGQINEDVYTDLANSGEKGKKQALKARLHELEPIGTAQLMNVQMAVEARDELLCKENMAGLTKFGSQLLVRDYIAEDAAWLRGVYESEE